MNIELRPVTDDNREALLALSVTPAQQEWMASNQQNLAEAADAIANSVPVTQYAIYAEDTVVGYISYLYTAPDADGHWSGNSYMLWRLMIDAKYQGKGFGKSAVEKVLEDVNQQPHGPAKWVFLCYAPENTAAVKLYQQCGFSTAALRYPDDDPWLRKPLSCAD